MFAKKILVGAIVTALLMFAGSPVMAGYAAEGLDTRWYEEDEYPTADFDLLDNAYKTVADTWLAIAGLVDDILGGESDDFEASPRMESPEPQPQIHYRYVPRHTTGYPKWIREPAK